MKEAELWKEITSNKESYGWYNAASLAGIFVESMDPSLKWVGDTFEDGFFGPRKKLIHSVGSVATVKFVPTANNEGYTGVFQGADHGLIRLSLAKQPDYSKTSAAGAYDNFAPGFGLKFLRDNSHSANMVAMFSVDGQDSWNFFKNDFTNHIPAAQNTAQKVLAKKFMQGTPFITYVGLSDFSQIDKHGNNVADFKFPFQLVFEPTLRNNLPDTFKEDFQLTLSKIPVGTALYKVHALAEPGSPQVHIGDIVITSQFTSSYFGDRYLFFKHQDMREDVKFKPEWEKHLNVGAGASKCPFAMAKDFAKKNMNVLEKVQSLF